MTTPAPQLVTVRTVATPDLAPADLARLLDLFHACWPEGEFTADDVAHAMGGVHWLAEAGVRIVGHASLVPRELEVAGRRLATGYVEAVATHPDLWRQGIATRLMTLVGDYVREQYELGALSTDVHALYARLGWERWRGPTWVRTGDGLLRTEDDDGGIMILRTARTLDLPAAGALSCEWRPGDPW
jgi:aminoglycoside 2'-N-acetyltransferase I